MYMLICHIQFDTFPPSKWCTQADLLKYYTFRLNKGLDLIFGQGNMNLPGNFEKCWMLEKEKIEDY